MAARNTDHVVMDGPTMVCQRCGDRYTMNLPCPISVWSAAAGAYIKIHRHCRPVSTNVNEEDNP